MRDALLGRPTHDLDFTTDARPDEILRIVKPITTAQWDIGRDIRHDRRRTASRTGEQVEITTYRADSYDGVTRKPTVEFGDTLEGDLARRDFTVNAMALRVPARTLVDPTRRRRGSRRAASCAPPPTRASASATIRCACCGPRGSRPSSASTSIRRPSRR